MKNTVYQSVLNFLVFAAMLGASVSAVNAQQPTPKPSHYKQMVVDVLGMSVLYQQQLNSKFSLNLHLSAGPHYPSFSGGENKISYLPYAFAELRFFPLHHAEKTQRFGFKPVDGLFVNAVAGMNLFHPAKVNRFYSNSILPTPVAAVGLGYQARFFNYGFVNLAFEYGLMQEQWYGAFGQHVETNFEFGPKIILGLGFSIPW